MSRDELIEELAEIEHDQWAEWSISLAAKENLSADRIDRWSRLWVAYDKLSEESKEQDRGYARKVLDIFDRYRVLEIMDK